MFIECKINSDPGHKTRNGKRENKLFCHERSYIEGVFVRYRNDLHRYLNSMVSSDEDAHDLLQETYLKVCSRENVEKLDYNIKGYLFVVATNLARDFMRRKTTRQDSRHIPLSSVEIISREASPEDAAEWKGSLRSIKASLLKLEGRTKQVFVMRRFMGYSTLDIATHFNVSKRTIERDLIVAMNRIKNDMKKTEKP